MKKRCETHRDTPSTRGWNGLQECADARGVTPLLAAAGFCGSLPLVELLLDARVARESSHAGWYSTYMVNIW